MHHGPGFLVSALLLAGISLLVVTFFQRLRLPAAAGFIVSGIVIGPAGFGLMRDPGDLSTLAELGVTLLLFTADHSFELRSVGGKRGEPILNGFEEWQKTHPARDPIAIPALRVGHSHTGEEVLAAAQGPGSSQVRGFLSNTQLFQVMMNAYGWKK